MSCQFATPAVINSPAPSRPVLNAPRSVNRPCGCPAAPCAEEFAAEPEVAPLPTPAVACVGSTFGFEPPSRKSVGTPPDAAAGCCGVSFCVLPATPTDIAGSVLALASARPPASKLLLSHG